MLILLEVSERTGTSLGQVLATGEFESAHTWNDHIRPTLKSGALGSATGVWQFVPATFHRIVKTFGVRMLAGSEADAPTGRARLDLGDGPFTDAQVRNLIQETVDGKRGADDEALQLLRHNFAVLAFAKHYLSVESGATTPEEDYLYHFLGTGQGRRVLALARGEVRDTLCVKPVEAPPTPAEIVPGLSPADGLAATARAGSAPGAPGPGVAEPAIVYPIAPAAPPEVVSRWRLETRPRLTDLDRIVATRKADALLEAVPRLASESAVWLPLAPQEPPPVSSQWGLPANSPVVTGNLGMFYRDGKGQTQPYTWAEFMDNLARLVQAKSQPKLVRAKYGVGFGLNGGDMPDWTFDPERASAAEFRHEICPTVQLAEALVTGPLDLEETRQYKRRLAALVSRGEDKPIATLPPETLSGLHHLKLLPPEVQDASTANPQVQKALHGLRKMIGKDEPDDPAQANLLMPAERVALEIYDRRLVRYAALQAGQQASSGGAPDLSRIGKMPRGLRALAAPNIAMLQTALAGQGLLTRPTQKFVWRDKKRKKHVEYKTVAFAGKPDKTTVAALDAFQWRNGLRKTGGVADAVTLGFLGLSPMGPETFQPLSGPRCATDGETGTAPLCATPTENRPKTICDLIPIRPRPASRSPVEAVCGRDTGGTAVAPQSSAPGRGSACGGMPLPQDGGEAFRAADGGLLPGLAACLSWPAAAIPGIFPDPAASPDAMPCIGLAAIRSQTGSSR